MKLLKVAIIGLTIMLLSFPVMAQDLAQHLQDISVTVKSPNRSGGEGQGSGIIITREIKKSDENNETVKVNFVWTAAHVVDNLRNERSVVDPKTGTKRQIVEFRDAQIVQELREDGRRVGEIKMDAKVIRFSDADNGEDLAILMVRKQGFVDVSAAFYLDETIPPIGTSLFHVGSLLGQVGANSMTTGIMSQHGRVLQLGSGDGTVFDQTTCTAFPGSSGGGVFLSGQHSDEEWTKVKGQYIGMLVRGAGEGFNLIVPVRRMRDWAKRVNAEWALNPLLPAPSLKFLKKASIEDIGIDFDDGNNKRNYNAENGLHYWFIENTTKCDKKEEHQKK